MRKRGKWEQTNLTQVGSVSLRKMILLLFRSYTFSTFYGFNINFTNLKIQNKLFNILNNIMGLR